MPYIAVLHLGMVSVFYSLEVILRLTGPFGLFLRLVIFGVGDLDIEKVVFFRVGHGGLDDGEEDVKLSETCDGWLHLCCGGLYS